MTLLDPSVLHQLICGIILFSGCCPNWHVTHKVWIMLRSPSNLPERWRAQSHTAEEALVQCGEMFSPNHKAYGTSEPGKPIRRGTKVQSPRHSKKWALIHRGGPANRTDANQSRTYRKCQEATKLNRKQQIRNSKPWNWAHEHYGLVHNSESSTNGEKLNDPDTTWEQRTLRSALWAAVCRWGFLVAVLVFVPSLTPSALHPFRPFHSSVLCGCCFIWSLSEWPLHSALSESHWFAFQRNV